LDLSDAILSGAIFPGADFANANLTNVVRRDGVSRADMKGATGLDSAKGLLRGTVEVAGSVTVRTPTTGTHALRIRRPDARGG